MSARTLVMGYHTMGCLGFDALLRHGFDVAAVFTHRDNPNEEIWWDSLAERAVAKGVPVHYPETMKDPQTQALVASYEPDFIFSFYFRFMIPPEVLEMASRGAFNLHGSLLPRYRGRAPVNWVLVNGETETGVSLHYMVAKPDAGDLVDQEAVPIDFDETPRSLYAKLEAAAVKVLDRSSARSSRRGTRPTARWTCRPVPTSAAASPRTGACIWSGSASNSYLPRPRRHPSLPRRLHHLDGQEALRLVGQAAGRVARRASGHGVGHLGGRHRGGHGGRHPPAHALPARGRGGDGRRGVRAALRHRAGSGLRIKNELRSWGAGELASD